MTCQTTSGVLLDYLQMTASYIHGKTSREMDILQKDLHQLEKWQEEWEMSFNPAKCSVMKLSTKKEAPDRSYNFCGQPLQEVDSHPYLGVEIDSKMSWKAQYQKLTSKANKVLGFLKRNLWFCPREMKETAYKTLVRPILEYAGCSWDPYKKKDIVAIEAVQRKAARFCMNDYKQLSSVTEMTRVLGCRKRYKTEEKTPDSSSCIGS
ncbi:uncharacterized protein [Amphiura filiformis]|uniref:uncharacterized protein n=1 Tax=Amphiura filiformis TaxID=82378 RepID=UPI003B218673